MGLRYSITFDDRQGRGVEVLVYGQDWEGGTTALTAGASPLVLQEDDGDGIDTPLRAWTGTLSVVYDGEADLSGLFAADVASCRVETYIDGELAWQGYVVPEVMRQPWVEGGEVTVNVQSPLAALGGLTLEQGDMYVATTVGGILSEALSLTGDWDEVVYPDDISVPAMGGGTDGWLDVKVFRRAFFSSSYEQVDEDDTESSRNVWEGMTGQETVEAVARLLGWTARERGRTLWFSAESVPGYKRISASALAGAAREAADVAAGTVELDGFTPAGTDHTQSQRQGYRRVRVVFGRDSVDDLLSDATDAANWPPLSQYQFQEDVDCVYDEPSGEWVRGEERQAGTYVVSTGAPETGNTAPCVQYDIAAYGTSGADGSSRTRLYAAAGLETAGPTVTEMTGEEELRDLAREKVWSVEEETEGGLRYTSTVGARRAVLRHRNAGVYNLPLALGWSENVLEETGPREVLDGFLLWACWRRDRQIGDPTFGLAGLPVVELHGVAPLLSGVALRLGLSIAGFQGFRAEQAARVPFSLEDGMGPHTVAGPEGMTPTLNDDAAWPAYLRIGDKCWNGTVWMDRYLVPTGQPSFLLPLQGTERTDEWATPKTTEDQTLLDEYDQEDCYLIPLKDGQGDISLSGEVEFVIYLPYVKDFQEAGRTLYNPFFVKDISLTPVEKDGDLFDAAGGTDYSYYVAKTGIASSEDVYSADFAVGTGKAGTAAYNLLYVGDAPLGSFASLRQSGREARPERLVLGLLERLYGRTTDILEVEVEAARLSPGAVVSDSATGRTYALTGVSWDVREDTCTYTFEDYIPYAEWAG